jgi:hypothetical protein
MCQSGVSAVFLDVSQKFEGNLLPAGKQSLEPGCIPGKDRRVGVIFSVSLGHGLAVEVLANHIGEIHDPLLTQSVQQIEDVLDVIVDSIPLILRRTDSSSKLAEETRDDREGTQIVAQKSVVDVNKQDAVGIVVKALSHLGIPPRRAEDDIIIQQHEEFAGSGSSSGPVQFPHGPPGGTDDTPNGEAVVAEREGGLIVVVEDENDFQSGGARRGVDDAVEQLLELSNSTTSRDDQREDWE